MREALVLGVDLGTGSARAFLFDTAGTRRSGVRLGYSWNIGADGAVEADADRIVARVLDAMDGAMIAAPGGVPVVGVGFSVLWHTILGVDAQGRAVTPVLAWNDTRATAFARRLRELLDERAVHARTGTMLHPGYPPARILWLRHAHPELATRVHRWLSLPEYLWLRLTGEHVADVSLAAGSGMLDRTGLTWDEEVLAAIDVAPSQLARVVQGADASCRGADVAGASRWPRLRDATWRLPVGDGACANIGSGCTDATHMALSIGTSAAMRVIAPRPAAPPLGLWSYPLDDSSALLGGAISNGGLVRSWLRGTLALGNDDAELDALLLAREPAAHGLVMLPYLAGERSPDWPLDTSGTIHGLRAATSPLDMLQAGMEAVAYRLAHVRRMMHDAVPDAVTIVASGGALQRSAYWPQLMADVLDTTVHVCTDAETSSRGAAVLALAAAGEIDACADVPAPDVASIRPRTAAHAAHAQAMGRHDDLARWLHQRPG